MRGSRGSRTVPTVHPPVRGDDGVFGLGFKAVGGPSPRARGRFGGLHLRWASRERRSIPPCEGTITWAPIRSLNVGVHPPVRGDDGSPVARGMFPSRTVHPPVRGHDERVALSSIVARSVHPPVRGDDAARRVARVAVDPTVHSPVRGDDAAL